MTSGVQIALVHVEFCWYEKLITNENDINNLEGGGGGFSQKVSQSGSVLLRVV